MPIIASLCRDALCHEARELCDDARLPSEAKEFCDDAHLPVEEDLANLFIYDGSKEKFHEWQFRVMMRWSSAREEDKPMTMTMITEGLRGDATLIAIDLGHEELLKETGMEKLIEAMSKHVAQLFPQARDQVDRVL